MKAQRPARRDGPMEQPMLDTTVRDSFDATEQAESARSASMNASAWLELLSALEIEFRPHLQPDRESRAQSAI